MLTLSATVPALGSRPLALLFPVIPSGSRPGGEREPCGTQSVPHAGASPPGETKSPEPHLILEQGGWPAPALSRLPVSRKEEKMAEMSF